MKYKVTFTQCLTQDETNEVIVEASNDTEARKKVSNVEYDNINVINANVIEIKNFNIIKVEEISQ